MRQQTEITTLYFNRGAFVVVAPTETVPEMRGVIECESTHRPGWYYVRRLVDGRETGPLLLVQWQDIRLDPEAYDVPR